MPITSTATVDTDFPAEAKPRLCVFCGAAADSREHVIAEWLSKRMSIRHLEFHPGHFSADGGIEARPLIRCEKLKTRQVCTKCNNGWMSELEAWAQKRFGNYVEPNAPFDHLAGLTPIREDSDRMIQWLLKTAIMVELAMPKGTMEKIVPALYPVAAGKEVPKDFHVWAAYIEAANFNLHLTRGFPVWNGGALQPYQIHAESMNFALQLNHLAFILFRCPNASPTVKAGVRLDANFRAAPLWLTAKTTLPFPNRHYFPTFAQFVDALEVNAQPSGQ